MFIMSAIASRVDTDDGAGHPWTGLGPCPETPQSGTLGGESGSVVPGLASQDRPAAAGRRVFPNIRFRVNRTLTC